MYVPIILTNALLLTIPVSIQIDLKKKREMKKNTASRLDPCFAARHDITSLDIIMISHSSTTVKFSRTDIPDIDIPDITKRYLA